MAAHSPKTIFAVFVFMVSFTIALGHPAKSTHVAQDTLDLSTTSRVVKYGQHCGVNHGRYSKSGSGGGRPIDAIDQLCKEHDQCGQGFDAWFPNCLCNRNFVIGLGNLRGRMRRGYPGFVRRTYITLFRSMSCLGPLVKNGRCRKHRFRFGPLSLRTMKKTC